MENTTMALRKVRGKMLVAVSILLALCPSVRGDTEPPETLFGPMSDRTKAALQTAVSAVNPKQRWPGPREKNLDALDRFSRLPWPRVKGLSWCHVRLHNTKPGEFTVAWKTAEDKGNVTFMPIDFKQVQIERARILEVAPADIRADLKLLADLVQRRRERLREWAKTGIRPKPDPEVKLLVDFPEGQDGTTRFSFDSHWVLFRAAYMAAEHDLQNEAKVFLSEICSPGNGMLPYLFNMQAGQAVGKVFGEFHRGSSRKSFLAGCRRLLSTYEGSQYNPLLLSVVQELERESKELRPAYLDKKPEDRTQEERIGALIYSIRDIIGWQFSTKGCPTVFGMDSACPTVADRLVAIGRPAIPYLIEALDDATPTRAICRAWMVRAVLRRQDVAMRCLERIVGCCFYYDSSISSELSDESPERLASVIANVKTWWEKSKDCSQAEMVRNQLDLRHTNVTLRNWDKVHGLKVLAMLEGPEAVMEEALRAREEYRGRGPVRELFNLLDPRIPIRASLQRFWEGQAKLDLRTYPDVYKYGDKRVYRELVRRLEAATTIEGSWALSDQAVHAAKYGRNWAIPIVARFLEVVKTKTSPQQAWSILETFQRLTGKDFQYSRDMNRDEKLAAIERARQWWRNAGRIDLADKIAEDHPPVVNPGDLLLTDEDVLARASAVYKSTPENRSRVIAGLGEVYTCQIQRALLTIVKKEADVQVKMEILDTLGQHPSLWHLPTLIELFVEDPDVAVRVRAGKVIRKVVANKLNSLWWIRFEPREAALKAARRLSQDPEERLDVRRTALDILMGWDSFADLPLLRRSALDPAFAQYEALQRFLGYRDERKKRLPPKPTIEE